MKSIVVYGPGDLRVEDRDMPKLTAERNVLVKTMAGGICGSDIHMYHGTSPFAVYPVVIGHEVVGEVVEIGDNAGDIKVGDRVILEPIETCGKCYACRVGRPNVCESLKVRGVHVDGGFQQYFAAAADKLHKLPDDLPWEKAVMIEPFSIGAQICWRGDVRKDEYVLIFGAGPTGLSALENAKLIGAKCIIADINSKRLEFAKSFGADHVIDSSQVDDLDKYIRTITGGESCNVVIDAVGIPKILEQAVELVSPAGRVVCVGFVADSASLPLVTLTKKEVTLVGSRLQTYQFAKCVKLFGEHDINTTRLITHVFDYTKIHEAIDLIENKPEQVGKIILQFNR